MQPLEHIPQTTRGLEHMPRRSLISTVRVSVLLNYFLINLVSSDFEALF